MGKGIGNFPESALHKTISQVCASNTLQPLDGLPLERGPSPGTHGLGRIA
jgi:hypothetical protein